MDTKLKYWPWVYHVTRVWEYPDDVEAAKIIGFAIILSTFGNNGRNIRPAAHTVARRAGMTDRLARRYRRRCIELGLFTDTGERYNSVPVLEISIPDGERNHPAPVNDPWAGSGVWDNTPVVRERRPPELEPTAKERADAAAEDDAAPVRRTTPDTAEVAGRLWDDD